MGTLASLIGIILYQSDTESDMQDYVSGHSLVAGAIHRQFAIHNA